MIRQRERSEVEVGAGAQPARAELLSSYSFVLNLRTAQMAFDSKYGGLEDIVSCSLSCYRRRELTQLTTRARAPSLLSMRPPMSPSRSPIR